MSQKLREAVEPTKEQMEAGTAKFFELFEADQPTPIIVYEVYKAMAAMSQPAEAKAEWRLPEFTQWLRRQMPDGTVICDPDWWAPRLYYALSATPEAQPAEADVMAVLRNASDSEKYLAFEWLRGQACDGDYAVLVSDRKAEKTSDMLAAAPAPVAAPSEAGYGCSACAKCLRGAAGLLMVVCPECGDKRCPKAADHANACLDKKEAGE